MAGRAAASARAPARAASLRAPDIARALARLSLGRGGPRDLACLRDGLVAAADDRPRPGRRRRTAGRARRSERGARRGSTRPRRGARRQRSPTSCRCRSATAASCGPAATPALDEARELGQDSRRFIAALQARYAAETGCRTLRIKHNDMLGYFVEVPQAAGEDFLQGPLERDLRPPPDHGRRDALLDRRARRARGEDRLGGRPRA